MHDLAGLLSAVAWPLVALLALLRLQAPLVRILAALADRIETAADVKVGKDGLELQGRLAAVEIKTNVAAAKPGQHFLATEGQTGIPADLQVLADRYCTVDLADYAARVFSKDHLADRMGNLVNERPVSRDLLAASGNEGLFAALATVVIVQPEPADLPRLLQVAEATQRKHVQYRLVLAFIELLKQRFVQPQEEGHIITVLNRFKNVDDPYLQRLIRQTEPLFTTLFV